MQTQLRYFLEKKDEIVVGNILGPYHHTESFVQVLDSFKKEGITFLKIKNMNSGKATIEPLYFINHVYYNCGKINFNMVKILYENKTSKY